MRVLKYVLGLMVLVPVAVGLVLAFGTSPAPPRLGAINDAVATRMTGSVPPAATYTARDGGKLTYRTYAGDTKTALLLIHGSTARSEAMNVLARHLNAQDSRPTVYAIDIRGHGLSGTEGDIGYIGQLEHDLEDFLRDRAAAHPDATWRLAGFSAGGGFALRAAGSPVGAKFERVVLISPMLDPQGPTYRPGGGGWAQPFVPRIIALSILDRIGFKALHGLPAIAFAKRDNGTTPTYSYRLLTNFGVGAAWATYLKASPTPPHVLVGARDELFVAEAYEPMLKPVRPDVRVTVVPGLGHMDMTLEPSALDLVAQALLLK